MIFDKEAAALEENLLTSLRRINISTVCYSGNLFEVVMDSIISSGPEEWMKRLSSLSEALRADFFENDQVLSAINAVEETVPDMLHWAREGRYSLIKGKVEERVQEALGLVNSFSKMVGRDPAKRLLVDHVVTVATRLLECDTCILDQRVEQAVRNHSSH